MFLLVGLLYPGQDLVWTNFQTAINTSPQYPSFDNPFNLNAGSTTLLPIAASLPFSAPTVGCQNWTYYVCLQTIDGFTSYVKLQFVNAVGNCYTNGSNPPDRCGTAVVRAKGSIGYRAFVSAARYNFYCRSTNSSNLGRFAFFVSNTNENSTFSCPFSTQFQPISFPSSVIRTQKDGAGNYWSANFAGGWQIEMTLCGKTLACDSSFPNSGPLEITAITLSIDWEEAATTCASFDIACQTGRIADAIFKSILFVVNGVSFVITSIAITIGYIGTIIITLFFGVIGMLAFFLTLPGAPTIVQSIISAIVIGMVAFLLITVLIIARGSSTVGD